MAKPSVALIAVEGRMFWIEVRYEEGSVVGECRRFPGCMVRGETFEVVFTEIKKLIAFALEEEAASCV